MVAYIVKKMETKLNELVILLVESYTERLLSSIELIYEKIYFRVSLQC